MRLRALTGGCGCCSRTVKYQTHGEEMWTTSPNRSIPRDSIRCLNHSGQPKLPRRRDHGRVAESFRAGSPASAHPGACPRSMIGAQAPAQLARRTDRADVIGVGLLAAVQCRPHEGNSMSYANLIDTREQWRRLAALGSTPHAPWSRHSWSAPVGGCWPRLPGSRSRSPALPNIIFIMADDLGYAELGCYGQQKIKTPHIDRLAAEGMRFTQHYTSAPVCCAGAVQSDDRQAWRPRAGARQLGTASGRLPVRRFVWRAVSAAGRIPSRSPGSSSKRAM